MPEGLAQVRAALATYLTTAIPGLRSAPYVPGQVNPPVVIIAPAPGQIVSYETFAMGGGGQGVEYFLRATILVGSADEPDSQSALDGYISHTGPTSVNVAIMNDPTLGGQVDYTVVTGAQGYGLLNWGALQYLGCHVMLTVGAE